MSARTRRVKTVQFRDACDAADRAFAEMNEAVRAAAAVARETEARYRAAADEAGKAAETIEATLR